MKTPTFQQLVVMWEIDHAGDINAYRLFRAIESRASSTIPLSSIYRILHRLQGDGLAMVTRTETSSKNHIPMPFYALTDEGRAVLRSVQEALA